MATHEMTIYLRVRRLWLVRLNMSLWRSLGWLFPTVDAESLCEEILGIAVIEYRTSRTGRWKRAN